MNYVVLNRRRNKKRQVLRWIALRKNFARLVFSLYLMEFLLSNAADDGMVKYSAVWKLRKFTLALFLQTIREISVFTKEVTKELI